MNTRNYITRFIKSEGYHFDVYGKNVYALMLVSPFPPFYLVADRISHGTMVVDTKHAVYYISSTYIYYNDGLYIYTYYIIII